MHCWLFCFLCVYCLGRQGYRARTVAGLNSIDQTGLVFAAIHLPQPPVPRDYLLEHTIALGFVSLILHGIYGLATSLSGNYTKQERCDPKACLSPARYCLVYSQAIPQLHTLNQEIHGER